MIVVVQAQADDLAGPGQQGGEHGGRAGDKRRAGGERLRAERGQVFFPAYALAQLGRVAVFRAGQQDIAMRVRHGGHRAPGVV
ncbi:Uncharacterised protein [Bordetella pertussis]|nr:Uncharacterised protein [Bordetella pertussis]